MTQDDPKHTPNETWMTDSPAGAALYALMNKGSVIDMGAIRQLDDLGQNRWGAMTLGGLLAALETVEDKLRPVAIAAPGELFLVAEVGSYRGYYDHLYVGYAQGYAGAASTADVLAALRGAVGKVFQGYKGGDFRMTETTPVWVGEEGRGSGARILGCTLDSTWPEIVVGPEDWMPTLMAPTLEDIQKLHRFEIARAAEIGWDEALDAIESRLVWGWGGGPEKLSDNVRRMVKTAIQSLKKVKSVAEDNP